jgi:hypothetical protein
MVPDGQRAKLASGPSRHLLTVDPSAVRNLSLLLIKSLTYYDAADDGIVTGKITNHFPLNFSRLCDILKRERKLSDQIAW